MSWELLKSFVIHPLNWVLFQRNSPPISPRAAAQFAHLILEMFLDERRRSPGFRNDCAIFASGTGGERGDLARVEDKMEESGIQLHGTIAYRRTRRSNAVA